jgi:competence protein ComEA
MNREEIIEKIKEKWKILLLAALALIGGAVFYLMTSAAKPDNSLNAAKPILSQSSESRASYSSTLTDEGKITIDLKGAIKNPNIYTIKSNLRLADVIKLAGGFTDQADQRSVNLAAKLKDEQVIYVATLGEAVSPLTGDNSLNASSDNDVTGTKSAKVNINTANLAALQALSGIGAKKAQDIIDYRTKNGNFKSIDELSKVTGIGTKTVEKLKDSITID